MGLSLLSALTIKGRDDIKVLATGPNDEGKYAGWIMYGERFQPLVNTNPIYDSEDEAKAAMQEIIDKVRETDLPDPLDPTGEATV